MFLQEVNVKFRIEKKTEILNVKFIYFCFGFMESNILNSSSVHMYLLGCMSSEVIYLICCKMLMNKSSS